MNRVLEIIKYKPVNAFHMIVIIFLIVSIPTFNSAITYDGYLYIKLSNCIWSCWGDWDWFRTPLFPASIAIFEEITGRNSESFVWLNTIFLVISTFLVRLLMKYLSLPSSLQILGLFAFFVPQILIYQHMLLSETAMTLVLLVIAVVIVKVWKTKFGQYGSITSVLVIAYYIKPSFLYLAPPIFAIVAISNLILTKRVFGWTNMVKEFAYFLSGLCVFTLLIAPWEYNLRTSNRMSSVTTFFPVIMGVVPPYLIGKDSAGYSKLIADGVPRNGMSHHKAYLFMGDVSQQDRNFLSESMKFNPINYLIAVAKTISVYAVPPMTSEGYIFFSAVTDSGKSGGTFLYSGPENNPQLIEEVRVDYSSSFRPGLLLKTYRKISPVLWIIVSVSFIMLPISFLLSLNYMSIALFRLSSIPLAYLGVHAVALMAIDRYAAPIVPLTFIATAGLLNLYFGRRRG